MHPAPHHNMYPPGPEARTHPEGWISFPAGCLVSFGGLVMLLAVAALIVLTFVYPGYRSSATYREALALVNLDENARAALGGDIRETALISVRSNLNDRDEGIVRSISLRVAGSEGTATLSAVGHETARRTRIESLRLTLSNGRRLIVRGRDSRSPLPPKTRQPALQPQ